jgi:hypothetical protein
MRKYHIEFRIKSSKIPVYLLNGFQDKEYIIPLNWNGNLIDRTFFYATPDHPLNWREIRRNTFRIDKYVCQYQMEGCYVNRNLEGHRTYIGENTKRLFKTTCKNCNIKLRELYGHTGYRVIYRKGRHLAHGTVPA